MRVATAVFRTLLVVVLIIIIWRTWFDRGRRDLSWKLIEISAGFGGLREECPPADAVRMLAEDATREEAFNRLTAWHATIPPLELAPDGWCRSEWRAEDADLMVRMLSLDLEPRHEQLVMFLFDHVRGHGWSRSNHDLIQAVEDRSEVDPLPLRRRLLAQRTIHVGQVEAAYAREAVARVQLRRSSRSTAKRDFARVQKFLLGEGGSYEGLAPFDGALASWWRFENPPPR